MGYFAELDAYNAREEYEAWLDGQEQEFLATIDDNPYCEEVVEWVNKRHPPSEGDVPRPEPPIGVAQNAMQNAKIAA